MDDIIELRETSPDNWQAKYQGNYGVYTIKIALNGNQIGRFSCTCPSSGYPCKHIGMIKAAIDERIAENQTTGEAEGIRIEELLQEASQNELYDFILRLATYNPELRDAVLLEFAYKKKADKKRYSLIVGQALRNLYLDYQEYYETGVTIDVLDQWLEKARTYVEQKDYAEGILICKACIEEFAAWLEEQADSNLIDYIDHYQSMPFQILKDIAVNAAVNPEELFDYCVSEMLKEKYAGTTMFNQFNKLLMCVAEKVNPDTFIALQDTLLSEVENKSSYEAARIVQRKIDFYRKSDEPEKAWKIIEENIQIASFRKELAEKYIAEEKFTNAKKLIQDYIAGRQLDTYQNVPDAWDALSLDIAQKEGDVPAIRKVSCAFIEQRFETKYFHIYKETFSADEWARALEDLIRHYEKNSNYFNDSVADVLVAEQAAERLLNYIEKHLTVNHIAEYYTAFAAAFPEKTLALFEHALDRYTEENVGRTYYERIAGFLKNMIGITGGAALVTTIVNRYKVRYKNRRALIEVLTRFCKDNHL